MDLKIVLVGYLRPDDAPALSTTATEAGSNNMTPYLRWC